MGTYIVWTIGVLAIMAFTGITRFLIVLLAALSEYFILDNLGTLPPIFAVFMLFIPFVALYFVVKSFNNDTDDEYDEKYDIDYDIENYEYEEKR